MPMRNPLHGYRGPSAKAKASRFERVPDRPARPAAKDPPSRRLGDIPDPPTRKKKRRGNPWKGES